MRAMSRLDPVTLQVMLGALRAACDEMGAVLVRSAHSANIKERRDASTALFDARGQMVMQAEHIPVHLGAMPSAVAAVLDEDHAPGDAWILNDPYRGGTHLPDITVITPLFHGGELDRVRRQPRPPRRRRRHGARQHARRLAHARRRGRGDRRPPGSTRTTRCASWPARMRNPRQREADLRAQLAAGRAGAERVEALIERFGLDSAARRAATRRSTTPSGARARASRSCDDGEREAADVLEARRRATSS